MPANMISKFMGCSFKCGRKRSRCRSTGRKSTIPKQSTPHQSSPAPSRWMMRREEVPAQGFLRIRRSTLADLRVQKRAVDSSADIKKLYKKCAGDLRQRYAATQD